MKIVELKKDLYYVGVIDHELKIFDVAVRTDYGTSYNSYILKTEEGNILFEGSKETFQDENLEKIKEVCPLESVKYLFVTHTEPDHSGSYAKLLELNPEITVVASFAALSNLDKIIRKPFKRLTMNPAAPMKIGGYTFKFVSGLMLHWPDVMFTYIEELKVLVSCDAFGAHFASDHILLSKEPDKKGYYDALEYYFNHIIGPFPTYVLQAAERIKNLDIEMICPGHGPIVDEDIEGQVAIYGKLANAILPKNDAGVVTIVYASAYGYTRGMAEYLAKRFREEGKEVLFHEIDALNYAKTKDKIIKDIYRSGTVLFGSPTLVGDAISLFYDLLLSVPWTIAQGKVASAFGNYGWSGEAVKNLSERLLQLRFKVIPGFRANFKLDESAWNDLEAYFRTLI